MVVQPVQHRLVFLRVKFHLYCLERFDRQDVLGVVQGRLLVVEGRETHALEVATIPLLPPHHDPHRPVTISDIITQGKTRCKNSENCGPPCGEKNLTLKNVKGLGHGLVPTERACHYRHFSSPFLGPNFGPIPNAKMTNIFPQNGWKFPIWNFCPSRKQEVQILSLHLTMCHFVNRVTLR